MGRLDTLFIPLPPASIGKATTTRPDSRKPRIYTAIGGRNWLLAGLRGVFMASMAISGATPLPQAQSTASSSAPVHAPSTATSSPRLQPDTVKLSVAGQAKMMHRQGMSIGVIASTLGSNVASIDSYLGIKVATAAVTAQPSATPQAATPAPSSASGGASANAASTQASASGATAAAPTSVQAASTSSPVDIAALLGKG